MGFYFFRRFKMKSLTHRKFNPMYKAVLLSSLLISSVAIAKPVEKTTTNKAKQTEIKKLKQQISQIKSQNQKKIAKLVADLERLEKSAKKQTKKETPVKRAKPNKSKVSKSKKKPIKKIVKKSKQTKKTATIKNDKKAVRKITAKKKKYIFEKKSKKVLGADEISVEQLDLAKLSAGTKMETTYKPITQKTEETKIDTIVQSNNESILEKSNINSVESEKNKAGSELYLMALTAFSSKNTDVAIHKLKEYVNKYPDGKMIPKAKYWLGESYLQKEPADYATARYYFLEVADKHEHHPQNNKQSKALYRLSQLSKINNYDDELKKYTNILQEKYPNSTETKLALELLKK